MAQVNCTSIRVYLSREGAATANTIAVALDTNPQKIHSLLTVDRKRGIIKAVDMGLSHKVCKLAAPGPLSRTKPVANALAMLESLGFTCYK